MICKISDTAAKLLIAEWYAQHRFENSEELANDHMRQQQDQLDLEFFELVRLADGWYVKPCLHNRRK